jgi:hypothetical protein
MAVPVRPQVVLSGLHECLGRPIWSPICLPAAAGKFILMLRLYLPDEGKRSLLDGSCPNAWCKSSAPEQRWLLDQAATAGRLTVAVSLIVPSVPVPLGYRTQEALATLMLSSSPAPQESWTGRLRGAINYYR